MMRVSWLEVLNLLGTFLIALSKALSGSVLMVVQRFKL